MLNKDEVEVVVGTKSIKHLESLGYNIPKVKNKRGDYIIPKGTKINVKVIDAPRASVKISIEVKCDYCGTIYYPNIANYHRGHKEISKDACRNCIPLKTKEINMLKYNTNSLKKISEIKGFILGRHKKDGDIVYNAFLSKGVTPMFKPEDYIVSFQDLPYICTIHKEKGMLYRNYDSIRDLDCACKFCNIDKRNDEKRYTFEFAQGVYKNKDYLLLEDIYNNCDKNMRYICLKHQSYGIQECTLFNALNYQYNCDMCKHDILSGENHWNWKGGISSEREQIKSSAEYYRWRRDVFARDGYICQCCGKKNTYLEAHHIKNFSDFPELRFDIDNGITLCSDCHSLNKKGSFHSVYTQFNNTREQLEEYIQRYKSGEFNELRLKNIS